MGSKWKAAATTCLAVLFAGLGHPAASGQIPSTLNCADPSSQAEINMCARADREVADGEMTAIYEQVLTELRKQDRSYADEGPEYVGAEALLRKAQDAWSSSRNDFCAVPGLTFFGGSMRPAVVSSCFAMLARSRAKELGWLLE